MAVVKSIIALLFVFMETSIAGKVYTVGDDKGWTILGNVNYSAWSSSKNFAIGDTLVFTYKQQYHNVMEVSKEEYTSCKPTKPLGTYTTGNDSIPIKKGGHYFFICGFPTHCDLGQKVDIRVSKDSSVPNSAASSSSPSESPAASPPETSKSKAIPCLKPGFAILGVVSTLLLNFVLA